MNGSMGMGVGGDGGMGAGFGAGGGFGGLEGFAAKQMAALQATSLAKAGNRSAPGGTSVPYFGGLLTPQSQTVHPQGVLVPASMALAANSQPGLPLSGPHQPQPGLSPDAAQPQLPLPNVRHLSLLSSCERSSPLLAQPGMAHPNPNIALQQMQQMHKKRQFLSGLATVHSRSNPLPPELVGVPWPQGYDISTSPWKPLDISRAELGVIRLAGKDVDLYKLWILVLQCGGGQKVRPSALSALRYACSHSRPPPLLGTSTRNMATCPPSARSPRPLP